MARSQTVAVPAATKPHRPTRRVEKKAPVAAVAFNPAEHHHEIAVTAYHLWLERRDAPNSPEEDWFRAEVEVRSRYQPG
jgi:hypothetical protein